MDNKPFLHEKALEEDARYSWLYANGYGEGPVERLLEFAGPTMADCKQILDAGCGRQGFARLMKHRGYQGKIVGVDVSSYLVRNADPVCEVIHASLDAIPLPDSSFDGLFCCDVLEHIPIEWVDRTLYELRRLVVEHGFWAMSIGTAPSGWRGPNGENLHMTVMPAVWWKAALERNGFVDADAINIVHAGASFRKSLRVANNGFNGNNNSCPTPNR